MASDYMFDGHWKYDDRNCKDLVALTVDTLVTTCIEVTEIDKNDEKGKRHNNDHCTRENQSSIFMTT